jgi:glucose-1-phosphate thymidylyltransferase
VLLNVAGKPILGHILDTLLEDGLDSATFVVGYMGDLVEEYVRSHYDFEARFVEQESREGLGHAIWLAREALNGDPVLIVLGDTIFEAQLESVVKGETSALGVHHVEDPRRFGVVETDDRGIATRLVEKPDNPTSNLAIAGLYYVKSSDKLAEALDTIVTNDRRTRGEFQLTDALQVMIEGGEQFSTFEVQGWHDCGAPETLLATNRILLEKNGRYRDRDGVVINPPVYIGDNATITNSIVGPYATIADEATVTDAIVSDSIVGERSHVECVVLSESIIGADASVKGDRRHVNIGARSELSIG